MEIRVEKYYEEIEDEKAASGFNLEDVMYLKDVKQRKLFVMSEIEQATVGDAVRNIMQFNSDDKGIDPKDRQPIILYLSSCGGDVDAGFELIDAIMLSETPVYTVNLGYLYSMGFLIGLAGHKRFATPNSKFLMHDGSNLIWDSGSKAQDRMEFQRRVDERIKRYVLSRSNITEEEYDGKLRVEWYLFADEAKEKGFCDYIIGVDYKIDEIV